MLFQFDVQKVRLGWAQFCAFHSTQNNDCSSSLGTNWLVKVVTWGGCLHCTTVLDQGLNPDHIHLYIIM